jgi:hypothetical protein
MVVLKKKTLAKSLYGVKMISYTLDFTLLAQLKTQQNSFSPKINELLLSCEFDLSLKHLFK